MTHPLSFPVFVALTDPATPLLLETSDDVVLPLWTGRDDAEAYLARTGARAAGLLRVAGPLALTALLRSDPACEVTAVAVDPPGGRPMEFTALTLHEVFAPGRRAA